MATEFSGSGDLARSLELLWGTGERPSRGPKPGLTVERIVLAAVELADREGLAALSMRRIATELGVGTMSLYRYVPSKAELVDVMLDTVFGEGLNGEDIPGDGWRAKLEAMAHGTLELYRRHPWLLQVSTARPIMGPNAFAGLELALRAVDGVGLTENEMLALIALVDGYVVGLARTLVEASQAAERTGISDEQFWTTQGPFVEKAMASYPTVERLMLAGVFTADDGAEGAGGFIFGLQRILDGIEIYIEGRQAPPSSTGTN